VSGAELVPTEERYVHVLQERPLSVLSDEQMVSAAYALAQVPRRRELFLSSELRTIADSEQDQEVPQGVSNPYWEIIRYMPGMPYLFGQRIEPDGTWCLDRSMSTVTAAYDAGIDRFPLCARYSWAIPSPGDIAWLGRHLVGQSVVEIGAGSGYWAWQLTQGGITVDAFDPRPPGENNWYNTHKLYHPVLDGDHTVAARYEERALMISWPGYETGWAAEALSLFKGDTLVYIGE
jgi:hypothetical protein